MIDLATDQGRAMADVMVKVQAQIIAFSHDYQMVMIFTACAIPLAIMIGSTKAAAARAVGRAGSCGDGVKKERLSTSRERDYCGLPCRLNHMPPSDSAPPIRWTTVGASPRNRIDSTALTIGPR